ncbi:MAG: phosphoribosylanthranilate isomerase [Desulfovibrio sp.]|uniref:phosphoribosylanthranilate isomerase n=1 Tax=Desulfovibrio sp. TaxID=885 RepID=UPI001A70CB2A|nr:phosphoribosylanthranilate isomerase [Desulfovibrio sp.]MBD5416610.1 phosphoribosylanthranilate isomerase [Desulfovibrio sp.]
MRIKVCGLTRQRDADAAARLGADFCGFIFHPASPRSLTPQAAAAIGTAGMARVGVFVDQGVDEIIATMEVARLDFAQLHGAQSLACAERIGFSRVIRVLWPERYASRAELMAGMEAHAPACAWFLLEAGRGGGGSGRPQDWSRLVGLRSPRPWLLAGGLTPLNVASAVAACAPDGLDFNSGVEEAPGKKSPELLAAALAAASGASGEHI